MPIVQANRVYEVLQEDLTGPKDNPFSLLCMVLVSMFMCSAVVVGPMLAMGMTLTPPMLVGAVVGSWVLGYVLGMLFGLSQGLNDSLPEEAGREGSDDAAAAMGCGCALALAQFAFGGLYGGLNSLAFGNSALPPKKARLATAVITMLYNQPQDSFSPEKIAQGLQASGLPTKSKPLLNVLSFLVSRDYLTGTPEIGYRCNPGKVDRFK